MAWRVLRQGPPSAPVRIIFEGGEEAAHARFDREHERMRQGVLRLVSPDGATVREAAYPMLRTRW